MYIAIDVGGTKIRIAAYSDLDPKSQILEMKHDTTRIFEQDMQNILQTLSSVENIEYVSFAVPGINIDINKGIVLAPNLPDWNNKDIKSVLSQIAPYDRIFISHDAVANGIGEALFAETQNPFLYITWGTGVGAAYIKKYDAILHTQQIEFGRQLVNNQPLEDMVGGINFPKNFNGKTGSLLDDADWEILSNHFAIGLANLYALNYAPQIIWGGGVAVKQSNRLELVMKKASEKFPYWPMPEYRISSFGEWGGVVGALANIKYNLLTKTSSQSL